MFGGRAVGFLGPLGSQEEGVLWSTPILQVLPGLDCKVVGLDAPWNGGR